MAKLEEANFETPKGAPSADRRVKVLYIAGWGRSGSTLLGRILGEVEGFFLVGELRYFWDRGLIENRLCSCGATFENCPVWQKVMSRAFEGKSRVDAKKLVDLRERGLRTRHILLAPVYGNPQVKLDRLGEYLAMLGDLYRAVQDVSGARFIVDTSKFPSYGYILQNITEIDLYVLHLVRDPRAVAYSWESRRKPKMRADNSPDDLMIPHNYIKSSLVWNEWNFAIERTWRRSPRRYMLLRYEDFVEDPQSSVRNILRFMGEGLSELPFKGEQEILPGAFHTFSGNPDRFRSGTIKIRPDREWKQRMSSARQAVVSTVSWPGLLRYGYPLRPQKSGL